MRTNHPIFFQQARLSKRGTSTTSRKTTEPQCRSSASPTDEPLARVCRLGCIGARELQRACAARRSGFRQTCEVACRGAMSNLEPTPRPKMATSWGFRDKHQKAFPAQDHLAVGILRCTIWAAKLASTGHDRLQGQSNEAQQTSGTSHNCQGMALPATKRGRRLEINCQFIAGDTGVCSTPESDHHNTRRLPCIERQPCRRVESLRRIGTASSMSLSSETTNNYEATKRCPRR